MFAKNSARRSAKRAAKALAEGRTPGKCGPRKYSEEELAQSNKESYRRFRASNLERRREYEAEWTRNKRAEKAIAEGREPGKIGAVRKYTDAERVEIKRVYNASRLANIPVEEKQRAQREYYASHKDEAMARSRNRRAIKAAAPGKHTAQDIRELYIIQKNNCAWCHQSLGSNKPHVDHYIPLSKGGSNDKSNLRLMHKSCNL